MSECKDNRLAKLYSLQQNGEWDDLFKGVVIISMDAEQNNNVIQLLDPDNLTTVLHTILINKYISYKAVDKCLIQWSDQGNEFALSFLTEEHRDTIIKQLSEISLQTSDIDDSLQNASDFEEQMSELYDLPEISMSTFEVVCSKLKKFSPSFSSQLIEKLLRNNNQYLRKLFETANDFIDLEDLDPVHDLAYSLNCLITYGGREFIDVIFSDEFYMDLFRVSDYYTPLYKTQHNNLYEMFNTKVRYHEVLDFKDNGIIQLIHQTFRIQFYRDSICLNVNTLFEDSLINIVYEKINKITEMICENHDYAHNLLDMLNPEEDIEEPIGLLYNLFSSQINKENQRTVIDLFKAFCGIELQNDGILNYLEESEEKFVVIDPDAVNILDKLESILQANKQKSQTVQKIVLLIEHMCKLSFSYCSSYFFNKKSSHGIALFHEIINLLLYSTDYGVQLSAYSIIRTLIGGGFTIGVNIDYQVYLRLFYTEFSHALFDPLFDEPCHVNVDGHLLCLDLLSLFLSNHQNHIRCFLADGQILQRLQSKWNQSSTLIRCALLQCFTTGISLDDSWFSRLFVEKGGLEILLNECEKEAVLKNNMLCSKILHFFEVARQKNNLFILPRIAAVASEKGLQEISPFKQIIEWNEKREEDEGNEEERKKNQEESIRDERMREIMDEEAYFDGSDDNEDEMNNVIEESRMKVEEEEEKVEEEKKDEEEKDEEKDDNPLSSFFTSKRPKPSSSTMKLTWNINLSSTVADNETKRMKLEEH